MRYVSIDIETGGLQPGAHSVLELAMIIEDTDKRAPIGSLPTYHRFLKHDNFILSTWAIEHHGALLDRIIKGSNDPQVRPPDEVWRGAGEFLTDHGFNGSHKAIAAGKNVAGFDLPFLPKALREMFHYRTLDPGSVLIDWSRDKPQSLAGLLGSGVMHDALQDARDVITVLRRSYG